MCGGEEINSRVAGGSHAWISGEEEGGVPGGGTALSRGLEEEGADRWDPSEGPGLVLVTVEWGPM